MIARDKPTTLPLAPALLAQLSTTAALPVSVEPIGGSPTGQPTGAVTGKGVIGMAPDTTRKVSLHVATQADRAAV